MADSARLACSKIDLILRNVNKSNLLREDKVWQALEWNDTYLPLSINQLPEDENGSSDYATLFWEEQKRHLSDTSPESPSIQDIIHKRSGSRPPHIQVINIKEVFQIGTVLGHGKFGDVFAVYWHARYEQEDDASSQKFAMKRMGKLAPRGTAPLSRITRKEFEDEVALLEKGRHHNHIVNFHASFTDEESFGIIMSPVADTTLEKLLGKYVKENTIDMDKVDRKILSKAHGCLLEAVRYIHDVLNIRHRDLKPSNILVHNDRILVCDFGSAYDCEPPDRSETTEKSQAGTRKYKAPEVLKGPDQKHNKKTDIFSLGAVFLEMHTVLRGYTLNSMAKAITKRQESRFNNHVNDPWTYADSRDGIECWLDEVLQRDRSTQQSGPLSLIKNMLCENREERKHARDLFLEFCTLGFPKYVCDSCKTAAVSAADDLPLAAGPSTCSDDRPGSRSVAGLIKSCEITRLEESKTSPNRGKWYRFGNFPQHEELELKVQKRGEVNWATTRWMTLDPLRTRRANEDLWLPAYYVHLAQNGSNLIVSWSDCDRLKKRKDEGYVSYKKAHNRNRVEDNLRMDIEFGNDIDVHNFSKLLLEDPVDSPMVFDKEILDKRRLVLHNSHWASGAGGGEGFHVACLSHLLESSKHSRLEPLFIPHEIDFVLPSNKNQRYTELVFKSFWVPEYSSDLGWNHDRPTTKGNFECVDLVPNNEEEYRIKFEEISMMSSNMANESANQENRHIEIVDYCNGNLRQFLSKLTESTGWELLLVFPANRKRKAIFAASSSSSSVDVLYFCNIESKEKRLAIRRKSKTEMTLEWISATLTRDEKVHVNSRTKKLHVKVTCVLRGGKTLALKTVTATGGTTKRPSDKAEDWTLKAKNGSAEIWHIMNVGSFSISGLGRFFEFHFLTGRN